MPFLKPRESAWVSPSEPCVPMHTWVEAAIRQRAPAHFNAVKACAIAQPPPKTISATVPRKPTCAPTAPCISTLPRACSAVRAPHTS